MNDLELKVEQLLLNNDFDSLSADNQALVIKICGSKAEALEWQSIMRTVAQEPALTTIPAPNIDIENALADRRKATATTIKKPRKWIPAVWQVAAIGLLCFFVGRLTSNQFSKHTSNINTHIADDAVEASQKSIITWDTLKRSAEVLVYDTIRQVVEIPIYRKVETEKIEAALKETPMYAVNDTATRQQEYINERPTLLDSQFFNVPKPKFVRRDLSTPRELDTFIMEMTKSR